MREIFESTIERLLADTVTPELLRSCDAGQWPQALWEAVEESGFALAGAPEALGGAGASWEDLVVIVRSLGRHAAHGRPGERAGRCRHPGVHHRALATGSGCCRESCSDKVGTVTNSYW